MKYRLMGLDRFNYEEYECGIYDTWMEAEAVKHEHEAHPNSTTGMEDRYWIDSLVKCKLCGDTFFGTQGTMKHAVEKHPEVFKEDKRCHRCNEHNSNYDNSAYCVSCLEWIVNHPYD